jgi:hypothetical protein
MRYSLVLFLFFFSSFAYCDLLDGTWRTGCITDFDYPETNVYESDAGEASWTLQMYRYNNCTDILLTMIWNTTVVESEGNSDVPGAKHLDYTIASTQYIARHQEVVDNFNNNALCGFSDWKIGVPKEVAGNEPCEEAARGVVFYDIFKIYENTPIMRFGRYEGNFDGTTPERRPIELDTDLTFMKDNGA